jgi:pimeloyl-ACP methyl ester carboxylesterase
VTGNDDRSRERGHEVLCGRGDVNAFFFGDSQRPLYGYFHSAPYAIERDIAVVIVPPFGQESIRCHRTLRLLGDRLAKSGLGCLRFDHYGSGHSAGEDVDFQVATAIEDIRLAAAEARRRAAAERIALVGVRLGATLSLLYGARIEPADYLVLWDTVVRGSDHLHDLAAAHEHLTSQRVRFPERGDLRVCELIGFDFSHTLIDDIRQIDVTELPARPARAALLVDSERSGDGEFLCGVLDRLGVDLTHQRTSDPAVWDRDAEKQVVASGVIGAIDKWLSVVTE